MPHIRKRLMPGVDARRAACDTHKWRMQGRMPSFTYVYTRTHTHALTHTHSHTHTLHTTHYTHTHTHIVCIY